MLGGWLTLIFCISGVITNIFTVVVLLHPRMRNSSTHVYLMALSACNIFLLVGLTINYSIKSIASYPELLSYLRQPDTVNRNALLANTYEQFYARAAPFTTPLLSMLLLCSTYLTVLVSGDRYFLICWPLLAEKIRTRKMAVRLVLLVFIVVNIYILPHWFEYRTGSRPNKKFSPFTNFTFNDTDEIDKLVELQYTRLGSNKIYLSIYRFYLNVPITFVIPFTLLALCNGSMIHQLLLIKKKKKRLGHRMKADIRITIMLIVIVLTFMLCRSINLFVNLLVQLSPCLNKNSLQRFNTFANVLIAFNGFVNFFLFAAFGQRFREMVLYIFFRHGQYPFMAPHDGASIHRYGVGGIIPSADILRRQSRRFSATTENDAWLAIARRRSSASMAVLYNPTEQRPRTSSNSSHLHLPLPFYKRTSNSSIDITQSPFFSSSDNNNTLKVCNNNNNNNNHQEKSSHSDSNKTKINGDHTSTSTTHHVTFV
ncbi:unnamed protein product [Adineta steineri]|uniref:G-protein coupled receptors family 1 profile domain-containing protein n=1 Tax=Adineta steineri TaxID=433720 RepID=A0A815L8S6_9BILA|nr:unnamed protein product [Adineta steineri]CAF1403371.1 unnamed protein product [Adineta steineri]CAF1614750.1 unnamed protein product [Adineta steineri]CAF1615032.1 unnamed protein product [Adineta steineri]